jgi:hypothetical protein
VSSTIAISVLALVTATTSVRATVYECEIKETRELGDDGVLKSRPQYFSLRFMVNKVTGVAVGEIFEHDLTWKLIEHGSTSQSFKTQGGIGRVAIST